MGYLGNLLTVLPDYREFDAVIVHGDSLLAPFISKPALRVMHGSALGEARSATSVGRCVLQLGVYAQELLTALIHRGVVAVSTNTTRDNPFVAHVIPHGVDDTIFAPWPIEKSLEPSVLFVGALEGRKRGRFLIDQFLQIVRPAHPTATLTVVGADGPSTDAVRCLTGVSDSDLAALYRRSWVYASPSTYEGFGLPYLEAMASGTPVVASHNPGSADVLQGGACGLLPDDDEFASTISELLSDESLRAALAEAGVRRAREFTLARMIDEYEKLLFELTGVYAKSMASV
jgi:glycosyltransferase involved in cell wall biosynthesis